jgi:succinate dehydrogenase/fumarate reductase flavoprotein subunit
MSSPRATARPPDACDLLVIGSGAGGLSAAVTAAHLGLEVVLVEKEPHFGGTTAWSGGWMFVPRNPLARAAGIDEPAEEPLRYLRAIVGAEAAASPRMQAFLAHGPAMVQFHLDHTALRFVDGNAIPDFHGHAPGAREGGRSVCAAPFDAGHLGEHLPRLKPPSPLLSFMGMSIGGDLRHFLRAARAWDSFAYTAGRVVRHVLDVARYGQGRLRMGGNALVAALLRSALDARVQLFERHTAEALLTEPAGHAGAGSSPRVVGARLRTPAGPMEIRARRGVVMACGGFPHDPARKAALVPHARGGQGHWSAASPGNTGDGLRLAEAAGGVLNTTLADAGAWAPVSLVPQGSQAPHRHLTGRAGEADAMAFPHLVERGKPGLIAVDRDGRRFVDEAGDYHRFMRALLTRAAERHAGQPVQAWLVCDHRFQRRYGLGHSKPRPLPTRWHRRVGYLQRAGSIGALAQRCGIDAAGLAHTVAAYNEHARAGHDPEFGRGETPYDRMQGDAEHGGPNPCVAPIERGPFYAVRVVPGSLGTFAGLACDEHARVLGAQGVPIPGLYAAGNDMASVMHGHYPSGGITLGPAMTFGYILAHHAAGRVLDGTGPPSAMATAGAASNPGAVVVAERAAHPD